MWPKNKFFNNDTLQTSLCECFVPRKQFLFSGLIVCMLNDLITIDTLMIDRGSKIFGMNCTPSIVVVKYKLSSISGRSPSFFLEFDLAELANLTV